MSCPNLLVIYLTLRKFQLQSNSSVPTLPSKIKRVFYMSSEGSNLLHEVIMLCLVMCVPSFSSSCFYLYLLIQLSICFSWAGLPFCESSCPRTVKECRLHYLCHGFSIYFHLPFSGNILNQIKCFPFFVDVVL